MRRVLAHWIHLLMFRRPLLALLQDSFKLLPDVADDLVSYSLHPKAVTELWLLALLAECF